MDCRQVTELLDAYVLGATEKGEAQRIERHVADCVRCWEELSKSQRTAALLALSIPIERAPETLRERIMAEARQEREKIAVAGGSGFLPRLRLGWQTTAGVLSVAGLTALAFAAFLQVQMSDLRNDKSDLEDQVQAADWQLEQQKQILAVFSAADTQKVSMQPASRVRQASVVYHWSSSADKGFLFCSGLPPLEQGEVYEVWMETGGEVHAAATFETDDGTCQVPMDLSPLRSPLTGIGISVERAGGGAEPSSSWLLYASFSRN